MVLVLLGLVVFSVQTSRNLSQWVKENLTVTVILSDKVGTDEARQFSENLYARPFSKNINYISREQALKEQTEAMGSDPSEFLGMNPFPATLELQLNSDYANADSLTWIADELRKNKEVADVAYQVDLMDSVNRNLAKLNILLLVLALLLTVISFSLINNTVRLSVLMVGIIAALLAIMALGAAIYALYYYEPGILRIITWRELLITALSVLVFGLVITLTCSYVSVNRFLKMPAGELYKI